MSRKVHFKRWLAVFLCSYLSACAYYPNYPGYPEYTADQLQRTVDEVIHAFNACPKNWDFKGTWPYENREWLSSRDNVVENNRMRGEMYYVGANMSREQYHTLPGGYYYGPREGISSSLCHIGLAFNDVEFNYKTYPGITNYVYGEKDRSGNYAPPLTALPGSIAVPGEQHWHKFIDDLAARYGGVVVNRGYYGHHSMNGNLRQGALILLPDGVSHIFAVYTIWYVPFYDDMYETELRKPLDDRIGLMGFFVGDEMSDPKRRGQRIDNWPVSITADLLDYYGHWFAIGARDIENAKQERVAETRAYNAEMERIHQATLSSIRSSAASDAAHENALHQQRIDMGNNVNATAEMTRAAQLKSYFANNSTPSPARSATNEPATTEQMGDELAAHEKVCAKIGRHAVQKDGVWECVGESHQVTIPYDPTRLCSDASGTICNTGEPISSTQSNGAGAGVGAGTGAGTAAAGSVSGDGGKEYQDAYEAVSYCWQTSNQRWICQSPSSKMMVSEETIERAEKTGVCSDYRDRQPTGNGYIYFCDRRQESYDSDIIEIHHLYGKAALRKRYRCPVDGMTVQCMPL